MFVNYLSKEDFQKESLSKEFFFNENSQSIPSYEVVAAIDSNKKGLGRNDAKFYTGSLNFSEEELQFIGNDPQKIKTYTIKVMEQYAAQFNRDISIDNVNWFAKIEFNRYYKGDNEDVISGIRQQGEIKEGLNTHVHFIVGRKSKDGTKKLSPKTNHRETQKGPVTGGFNRDFFKQQGETLFDDMFGYLRPLEESYQFNKIKANGSVNEKVDLAGKTANESVKKHSYSCQSSTEKEYRIQQLSNYICFGIDKNNVKHIDIEKLLAFERNSHHSGCIYRSLVNLNRCFQQGKIPTEYDLTDRILNYAHFLETKSDSSHTSEVSKPIIFLSESTNQNQMVDVVANPIFSYSDSKNRTSDDDDDLLRKKKKKKKNINRDFGMGT
jgi:hypothetical protein